MSNFDKEKDYDFWAVIFEDKDGVSVNRKDMSGSEIRGYLTSPDEWVKIWREFSVESKPEKWVVWPHSKSEGWLNKIEGNL